MADWTANSDFGTIGGRREPVLRMPRDVAPRPASPRAERFAPVDDYDDEAHFTASAALADYNAAQDGPLEKARLAVWVGGGVVSLALIAGIGVWGYKLVLREVLGLPVVVAVDGPMRVAPADPGGEVVPQQGLAVNTIPAAGTAAPPSDVLMLAPQTPGLAEEDMDVVQTMAEATERVPAPPPAVAEMPLTAEADAAPSVAATDAPAAVAAVEPAPAAEPAGPARLTTLLLPSDGPMTTEEILAFADQIAAGQVPMATPAEPALQPEAVQTVAAVEAQPLGEPTPPAVAVAAAPAQTQTLPSITPPSPVTELPAAAEPVAAALSETPVVAASAAGVAAAPRPLSRPARAPAPVVESAPAAPVEAAAPATAEPEPTVAPVASGAHLVQLGAFDSAEIAASEWQRLQGRFGEFLGSREHLVQETQSGGRTLYRLRVAGFAERADARRLCAALTAEGQDCIPVTVD